MQVKGKVVLQGKAEGIAMVTEQPVNFLAAYSRNLALPWKTGKISDAEHELHGKDLRSAILVMPCCSGSTGGGVFLLEAIRKGIVPRGIVAAQADTLLVSGAVLAEIWLEKRELLPIVECPDILSRVGTGDWIRVEGEIIEICNSR
jgi:predicted aconitase with swiveling domain